MSKLLMVLATISLLSSGCVKKNKEAGQAARDSNDLVSYEDKARGVVCYRVQGWDGMSCVKVSSPANQ